MSAFHLLAALFALYMLARHGRAAGGLLGPPEARARALVPFLTCLAALGVLAMAARALLAGRPGAAP